MVADRCVLGLSRILGYLTPASIIGPGPEGDVPRANGVLLNLAVEMYRETFPATVTPSSSPVLHLAYWHLRLLAYLLQPSALSSDIMWAAKSSAELLTGAPEVMSPLNHHFTCLTTLSLIELTKVEKTRIEATRLLKEMLDSPVPQSSWDFAIRDTMAAHIRPSTSSGGDGKVSQGLQHLADLAAATGLATADGGENSEDPPAFRNADNYEAVGFNPRPMLRDGYFNALASTAGQ